MEYVLFSIFILAFYHFIYESILLPSFRLNIRFRLFKLRDELRNLKIEDHDIDEFMYDHLEVSINDKIRLLHIINIQLLHTFSKDLKNNKSLAKKVSELTKRLEECQSEKMQRIRYKIMKYTTLALAVNSGGWFIYMIPIILGILLWNSIKALIKSTVFIPQKQIKQYEKEVSYA